MDPLVIAAVALAIAGGAMWWRQRRSATVSPPPIRVGSADADAQTLRALRDAGADLTKPTELRFYLYFATREVADAAADSARTSELASTVRPAADGNGWLLLVQGTMVPSESAIRAASTRLQGLAASLGGEYDGWEAKVTP